MDSSPHGAPLRLTESPVPVDNGSHTHIRLPPPTPSSAVSSTVPGAQRKMRTATPMHRFGPSGPWPWTRFSAVGAPVAGGADDRDIPYRQSSRGIRPSASASADADAGANDWRDYPTALFPEWTQSVLQRSGLTDVITSPGTATTAVRTIDVLANGHFRAGPTFNSLHLHDLWQLLLEEPSPQIRIACYFVEDISGPIMQMLGTTYDIQPFYFSSAQNAIATRYQEDIVPQTQDHITVTLPFLRAIDSLVYNRSADKLSDEDLEELLDVQSPLPLVSSDGPDQTLLVDVLAIHMVRTAEESTMIVVLPKSDNWLTTSAEDMQTRLLLAGKSVYWAHILAGTKDPTFMLVLMLWHALYAWDEAIEVLQEHIWYLERRVMIKFNASDIWLTRELHIIRTMVLHYDTLLKDFTKTVEFILAHPNGVLERVVPDRDERQRSHDMLRVECDNITAEIERLQGQRVMLTNRIKNVIDLVFSTLSVTETETSLSQGWVMQQLTYVTMAFLPATFVATVFGMNLTEFTPGTNLNWKQYVATTVPLSGGTVWLMIALTRKMHRPEISFLIHILWPLAYAYTVLRAIWRARTSTRTVVVDTTLGVVDVGDGGFDDDGEEDNATSRARVSRYWGWRPRRGNSTGTTAMLSRAESRVSHRSFRADDAAAASEVVQDDREKSRAGVRFRHVFGLKPRPLRRVNTLATL